jgi:hypothetical protein
MLETQAGCQGGCNTRTALAQTKGAEPMVQVTSSLSRSRFDNLTDEMLADALGHANAIAKGAIAEVEALKSEFKRRGLHWLVLTEENGLLPPFIEHGRCRAQCLLIPL